MTGPFARSTALLLGLALPALAADPVPAGSLIFAASDFPELARGVRVPRAGDYTIKAWTAASSWTLARDGRSLSIAVGSAAADGTPRWATIGREPFQADAATTLRVIRGEDASPVKPQLDGPPAGIALLSLSTDPDFVPDRALDVIRGDLKTTSPPPDPRRTVVRTNREGIDFDPPASPRGWRDRAAAVRERLLVTSGLWPMLPRTELHPRVVGTLQRDGYAIDRVVLETLPGFLLSGNLYRPTRPDFGGRRPAVLCPHGHWAEGRVYPDVQARCVRLAQLGCVVFAHDMVGYVDGKPFGHAFLNDRLRRWGLSLVTLQTWNSIRVLDWLAARDDVDAARIGVTGESGGATQTLLLTGIDDRVKVAAPVVMVSDGYQGGCSCENAAGLRLGTDNVEIAALAAPRPLKMVGATGDWTARLMTNAYPSIQLVYAQAGALDRVSADVFDFPHNYNQTSRNAVYAFFGRFLLGLDDPASTREGAIRIEDPADLMTFGSEHPYPADAKGPAQLEAELVGVQGRQIDRLAPGLVAATWEASRDRLLRAQAVRLAIERPTPRESTSVIGRIVDREGFRVGHHRVGRKATGERIAAVRLTPERASGKLTVLFTPRGKADLVGADGAPSPIAQALLDRGQSIVGFDPLLVGESVDPARPTEARPAGEHSDTYNPSLAGDRAQDLATILSWAQALPDVHQVSLVATGAAGPLALLARPSLDGLARTAVDLDGFDPGDGSRPIPPGLDLPGMLQFGGPRACAALAAPAPLWIARAGAAFDAAWPAKAYALAGSPEQFRLDREGVDPAAVARWIDSGN